METHTLENGQIQLTINPSVPYVLNGIINKMYVLFEFQVHKQFSENEKQRAPIELSIVLDRSGSMNGSKIENSKIAVKKVIENLKSNDKIHFVVYDNYVDVIFIDGDLKNKDTLKILVDQVYARGMTNLSGGIIKGFEAINKDSTLSKRIFLFSDGLANEGITSHEGIINIIREIHKKSVNITSIGIGHDFNEDLMQAIAEHGAGDYFFIDVADNIPTIVNTALSGLLTTVTTNTVLKVRGKSGVTVTKMYSYELPNASLGDLRDDETRLVLVELEVLPEQLVNNELLSYSLTYNAIDDPLQQKTFTGISKIERTDDESKIVEEDSDIMITRNLLEAAEEEDNVIELIDRRNYKQAFQINEQIQKKLKTIEEKDKSGRIRDKLFLLQKSSLSMMEGIKRNDMRASRKNASYSRYQTKHSKRR